MPDECQGAPHKRHCEFADASAAAAVKKTFAILGVDVDEPAQVKDFQESLRFGEKLRKASDYGMLALVAAIVVAAASALWIGISSKLSH